MVEGPGSRSQLRLSKTSEDESQLSEAGMGRKPPGLVPWLDSPSGKMLERDSNIQWVVGLDDF